MFCPDMRYQNCKLPKTKANRPFSRPFCHIPILFSKQINDTDSNALRLQSNQHITVIKAQGISLTIESVVPHPLSSTWKLFEFSPSHVQSLHIEPLRA